MAGKPSYNGNTMTVSLAAVPDNRTITVSLTNVTDSFGQTMPATNVQMSVVFW